MKVGRERLWQFDPKQLDEARRSLELIAQQWDQALGRLKMAVERGQAVVAVLHGAHRT